MKTMHWLGVIATSLISASTLVGCSGDDAPPVNGTGGMAGAPTGTAGAGASAGGSTGTAGAGTSGSAGAGTGGAGTAGSGFSNVGVQLKGSDAFTYLTATEAPAGAAAPGAFSANACASCHGAGAQGTPDLLLGPEIRFTPTDFLKGVVRNARKDVDGMATGMVAFKPETVSDADLDAIAAWLLSLPKPTDGAGLYHAMCGNCHGPKMPTGGGSPINIKGDSIANVDKFVRMGGSGTDVNDRMKYMPKFDTTLLSETELTMIKTYIEAK
jgi:mono/diheme cytochrome c family protein